MSAAFFSLAEALEVMRRDAPGAQPADGAGEANTDDLLTRMIQTLLSEADTPPREVEGVSEEFCDSKQLDPDPGFPGFSKVMDGTYF